MQGCLALALLGFAVGCSAQMQTCTNGTCNNCVPTVTCAGHCGNMVDNCGNSLSCGDCAGGQTCANNSCQTSGGAAPWSGILDPARGIDWSTAGVIGGIPHRTTICATINPGATTAQIQTAINNCPAGQVLSIAAGTYTLTGSLAIDHPI